MVGHFVYVGRGQYSVVAPNRLSAQGPGSSGVEPADSGTGNTGSVRRHSDSFSETRTPKTRAARILIVDDHPLVADAFAECIRAVYPKAEVVQATKFEEAVELVAGKPFDLVLLDYRLPGIQGLQGLRLLRGRFPELRIAMISGVAEAPQILEAIQLGAVGFIPKDLPVPALIKALELILLGESFVPAKMLRAHGMGEEGPRYKLGDFSMADPVLRALTPREIEVLGWVECGKPNKQIADILGTKKMTIAFHLRNVFKKLGVSNRTEAASIARKLGLCGDALALRSKKRL